MYVEEDNIEKQMDIETSKVHTLVSSVRFKGTRVREKQMGIRASKVQTLVSNDRFKGARVREKKKKDTCNLLWCNMW